MFLEEYGVLLKSSLELHNFMKRPITHSLQPLGQLQEEKKREKIKDKINIP